MEALRRKCRPKHQVLILRCYPQVPKNSNVSDIKPNGSELSYLLYYASSRHSKLTKVGAFLEKRTASDLHKSRIPSVLVTCQILTAFLSSQDVSTGNGFGLFAPYVLRILKEILEHTATDTQVTDAALPVWESFCKDQDHATLAADAEYRALFGTVVRSWANYASKNGGKGQIGLRGRVGAGEAIKLRKTGLEAVKSITTSEALANEPGRQLDVVVPVILQNLYSRDAAYLAVLDAREKEGRQQEKEQASRARPSMSTIRTTETNDPRMAEGTVADADRMAEEDTGVLALQCLKSIFNVENRGQIRQATSCVLNFIATQSTTSRPSSEKGGFTSIGVSSWATALFKLVCTWTPVQDRFIVLFTAVETLIRSPIVEQELERQLVLAHAVSQVLGSSINLIGLSVMDMLLGLIQHVLLVLQLGTTNITLNGGRQIASDDGDVKTSPERPTRLVMEVVKTPSPMRVQLLAQLRICIANLATHIYYTDQISDMVAAILLRLKPSPTGVSSPSITALAIEDPTAAAADVASHASLKERPNTDGFFSFDTAREVALNAVKDIMTVANTAQLDGSSTANNRSSVPLSVWEGTQWLLRDSSKDVRRAYIEALCTWLAFETKSSDSKLEDGKTNDQRKKKNTDGNTARRAASNASARHRAAKKGRSTFLQLLHLAVYEDALQRAETVNSDNEFALLHLLLTTFCDRLGINVIRIGLPMIFRLQEDILGVENSQAKIRIGGLVHGYFWALCKKFDLEASFVGQEILSEITRRQQHSIWAKGIQVPPFPISEIASSGLTSAAQNKLDQSIVQTEALKPFDHRQQMVECISNAYTGSVTSPPTSAPGSPTRSLSMPVLNMDANTHLNPDGAQKLPKVYIDELMVDWTKANLLAAIVAAAPKSASLSGSRTGGQSQMTANNLLSGNHRHLLAAANTFPMQHSNVSSPRTSTGSPHRGHVSKNNPSHNHRPQAFGQSGRLTSHSPAGTPRMSGSTVSKGDMVKSNGGTTTRIEELKRVLATGSAAGVGGRHDILTSADDDTGSESMIDVEGGDYEGSMSGSGTPPTRALSRVDDSIPAVATSTTGGIQAYDSPDVSPSVGPSRDPFTNGRFSSGLVDGVKQESGNVLALNGTTGPAQGRQTQTRNMTKGFGTGHAAGGKMNLSELLDSIDIDEGEGRSMGGITAPPY